MAIMSMRDRYLSRRHDLRLVPATTVVWTIAAIRFSDEFGVAIPAVRPLEVAIGVVGVVALGGLSRWLVRAAELRNEHNRVRSARIGVVIDVMSFTTLAAAGMLVRLGIASAGNGAGSQKASADRVSSGDGASILQWLIGGGATEPKAALADLVATLGGDGPGLIAGMSVGDTSAISPALDDAMMASSLGHITAVSGANCAVGVAMGVAVATLVGWRRNARIVSGMVALCGFVLLVGAESTVLRASVMLCLVLVARLAGLAAGGVSVLAATVCLLLLIDPALSIDIGFGLSVSATAGLVVLARPIGDGLDRWLPSWLAQLVALPVAAQLACLPLLVVLGSGVSVGSIVANVIVAPVTGVVTVLGLLACLVVLILPPVATALSLAAWPFTEWVSLVARFFADNPVLVLAWPSGTAGAVLAAVVALLGAAAAMWRSRRRVITALAVVLTVVVAGSVIGSRIGVDATMPRQWSVAACDVGQGDGLVFRAGESVVVVDAGADGTVMLDCLSRIGVTQIDVMVITHWDSDHAGGAAEVATQLRPDMVVSSRLSPGTGSYDAFAAIGLPISVAARGDRIVLPGLVADALWPPAGFDGEDNDGCLVLAIDAGGVTTLTLCDTGEDVQNRLIADVRPGEFDVLKVAHHGSADFSRALYEQVATPVALVSVGANNPYRHPRQEVLAELAASGSRVARTDLSGTLIVSMNPDDLRMWCERTCEE